METVVINPFLVFILSLLSITCHNYKHIFGMLMLCSVCLSNVTSHSLSFHFCCLPGWIRYLHISQIWLLWPHVLNHFSSIKMYFEQNVKDINKLKTITLYRGKINQIKRMITIYNMKKIMKAHLKRNHLHHCPFDSETL